MATTQYWALVFKRNHLDEGYFYRKVANLFATADKWDPDSETEWVRVSGDLLSAMNDSSDTRVVDDQKTRWNFNSSSWDAHYVKYPEKQGAKAKSVNQVRYENEVEKRTKLIKEANTRKKVRDVTSGFSAAIDTYVGELNALGITTARVGDLTWPVQPWSSSNTPNEQATWEESWADKYSGMSIRPDSEFESAKRVTPRYSTEGYANNG